MHKGKRQAEEDHETALKRMGKSRRTLETCARPVSASQNPPAAIFSTKKNTDTRPCEYPCSTFRKGIQQEKGKQYHKFRREC